MTLTYIGIGSNQGNRMQHIQAVITLLKKIPESRLAALSPLYETEAITLGDPQPDFINAVAALETELGARELFYHLHEIEDRMGRPLPRTKWQQRTIDLDILAYGNRVTEDADLVLPHPEMAKRLFVLLPLRDIASDWIHPKMQEPIDALIAACQAAGDRRIQRLPC